MGGARDGARAVAPRLRVSSCVLLAAFLGVAAGGGPLDLESVASTVPLPVIFETLIQDSASWSSARVEAPPDAAVPVWTSRAARPHDDSAAREELQVTSVVKDDSFKFGNDVRKWHSLVVGTTTYLVGLGPSNVTLLTASFVSPDVGRGHTYSLTEKTFNVGGPPLAAALFKHWNAHSKTLEAILVLSTDSKEGNLVWYRIGNLGLEVVKSWPFHKRTTYLKAFKVRERMNLLVLSHCDSTLELVACETSADLYDFTLEENYIPKLSKTLPLESEAVSAEVGEVGDELYLALALPAAGITKLYYYKWPLPSEHNSNHSTYGSFEFFKDVPSPQVLHAVFFHVSYKMYLAVGGETPAVYRFVGPRRIEGCAKALKDIGFISKWLVLPILTYRDEVVLLAEVRHTINSSPYHAVVALTWASAGVFNWQNQPQCIVDGKISSDGMTCIIVEGGSKGLEGAVTVQLGDTSVVSVLVPKGLQPSSLYRIYAQLQPVVNPLLAEVLLLKEAQSKLQAELRRQTLEMATTENWLLETLSSTGPNIIEADWVIHEVETPVYEDENPPPINLPGWTPDDHAVKMEELTALMTNLEDLTNSLQISLVDAAVPVNGELHLHGYQTLLGGLEVANHSSFESLSVTLLNGEPVLELLKDVVRVDHVGKIGGIKTISNLDIVNVEFNRINGVFKDDLVFNVPGKPVRVLGNLEVLQILHVVGNVDLPSSGTVGGFDLSEEIFLPGKKFRGLVQFDEVTVEGDLTVTVINTVPMQPHILKSIASGVPNWRNDTHYERLVFLGSIEVERLNGFAWKDIIQRIVWKDSSASIDGITYINGTLSGGIAMSHLNGLDFPSEFVQKTGESQLITGTKTIQNVLAVKSMDVSSVNAIPVDAFVTKRTNQILHGDLKLKEAIIDGDMKVDLTVNGIRLDQMHRQSALLGKGEVVSSNVVLSNLEVEGPIEITGTLDARIFKDLGNIAVLSNGSETTVIRGKKLVQGNLIVDKVGIQILSGEVNGKNVLDIARRDTIQEFQGEKTVQNAVFHNVQLTGHWDNVNVITLNAEAVRLTGIQDTQASLNFADESKLFATRLVISEHLNTEAESTFIPLPSSGCDKSNVNKSCILEGPMIADIVRVGGAVVVDKKVCGWTLDDFDKRRMSRSRPQVVKNSISFGSIKINAHINVSTINNLPIVKIGQPPAPKLPDYKELDELLRSGGFAIDELFVIGNIHTISGVNGLDLALIASNSVKLIGDTHILSPLVFEDGLTIDSLAVDGLINTVPLPFLIKDGVLKSELQSITLEGEKTFDAGFTVDGNIATRNFNGLDPLNIITKHSATTVQGPLRVLGKVHAGNINASGLVNDIPISAFQNKYQFLGQGHHLLKGNARFLPDVSADDLYIGNSVNNVQLEQFLKSVVIKNEFSQITGHKLFMNTVAFKDVEVDGLVNNMTLKELASDVVVFNSDSPVTVHGHVTFADGLVAPAGVSLSGDLDARELDGCLIKEWLDNAIFLNKPTSIFGVKNFASMKSKSELRLKVLNAVHLDKIITLQSAQNISSNIEILSAALRHNLAVSGRVNGKGLQSEFDNTLLTTGKQNVVGSKSFLSGLTVKSNVVTRDKISGRNITNVVTLAGEEYLNGPLKFLNMVLERDLRVSGLISNVDVQKWQHRAFLKSSHLSQRVSAFWDVKGQVRFMEDVSGQGLLGGQDVHVLSKTVNQTRARAMKMQAEVKDEWVQLCHDTDALLARARAQPFLFQQIEVVQALPLSPTIASMHAFEALSEQFLAVSYADNCSGAMYHWNRHKTAWELLDAAVQNIGSIERWATLRNSDATYLITSAVPEQNCPYQHGNVWRFERSNNLQHIKSMDTWHDAEVDPEADLFHLVGRSGILTWSLEGRSVKFVHNNSVPAGVSLDRAQFVPRSAGLGLSLSDGKSVTQLEGPGGKTSLALNSNLVNSNLPARSKGNVVTMKVADGRQLVAATAESSDMLVVYEDVVTGRSLARIQVHGAQSLSVMELTGLGRNGQTLLAFIENERQLRVMQYKGVEGFVDVTKVKLAVSVKEMVAVRLFTRGLVNKRHFLLLRSDHQVLSLEVEMSGDPLDASSLNCNLA